MVEPAALLQTDIVDSTKLGESLGDAAMSAFWLAHDRIARDLLRTWQGREIDKSDGFLLLFADAADAAGYALAYHRALSRLTPPVMARAGLHVGPVIRRENLPADVAQGAKPLEVEGQAKPVTARAMALAGGGQTFVTTQARDALVATRWRLQSHGHWRLHGVESPIELFELGDDETCFVPPADTAKAHRVVRDGDRWLPARTVRHSLPAERDSFVGRDQALQELARRLQSDARLVSLLGTGGTGKTRLAQHFGWLWLGDYPGGVWFCDLSQARTIDDIVHAVAQGLDVPLGSADPILQLGHALAGRGRCLVILDNFEQVSRWAEGTVGVWLDRAPAARFIVTTRVVLGIVGEHSLEIAPLAPADAVALFLRRAAASRQGLEVTDEEQAAVEQLVRLLDGLPLAIELAAARVRVMSPSTLLRRVDERFSLLSSSDGQRPRRQATLRATFDWSWDLLDEAEKAGLAQLSVFKGGIALTAVEATLDLTACAGARPAPLDVLQSLVEKSLLRRLPGDRFDLLGTIHEYAAEQLRSEGSHGGSGPASRAAAEARHGRYFAALGQAAAVRNSCEELENLAVACRRAAERGDAACAAGTLENAWAALRLRGPFRVGIELAGVVDAMEQPDPGAQARVVRVAGEALLACGRVVEAELRFEAALSHARAVGDASLAGHLLGYLGDLKLNAGRVEDSRADLLHALMLAGETGDQLLACKAQSGLGNLHEHLGDMKKARSHYEAGLALARALGDRRREGGALGNLGLLCHTEGLTVDAERNYTAALALACELGDRQWEGNTRCNLGLLHHAQGRLDEARSELLASLAIARELGHARLVGIVLCNLGLTYGALGDVAQAVSHHEAALSVIRELGDRRSEGQVLNHLGALLAREHRFSEARDCLERGERLLETVSDRMNLALLLCSRCELEHLAGDAQAAARHRQRARSLAADAGLGDDSELARALSRVHALTLESV